MHYWKVPRLGAYLAIPMSVKSTLSVETLQKAFEDYNVYKSALAAQAEEKKQHDADYQAKVDQAAADGVDPPAMSEKEWPEITLPALDYENRDFVICIDLMGQDREFTDAERTFLLETIYRFRTHWEQYEYGCLEKDRDALLAEKQEDSTIFTDEFKLNEQEKDNLQVMRTLYPKQFPEEGESVEASTVKDDASKSPSKKDKVR